MANFSLSIIQILEPRSQAESGRILQILIYNSASCIFQRPRNYFFGRKTCAGRKKRMAESYKFLCVIWPLAETYKFLCNIRTGAESYK
jgi:hypothetical protein